MPKVIVTTSWDDGHKLDLKLAELLRKYDLKGTFYVAPENREFKREDLLSDFQLRKLSQEFEIGAHTMTHPRLGKISAAKADKEIRESKEYLEKLLEKPVTSFCYPGGSYTFLNVQQVKKHGFTLARTIDRFSMNLSDTPLELPTSIHTYSHRSDAVKIARFANLDPEKTAIYYKHWEILGMAMFDKIKEEGGVFHVWGHSWEIEECQFWERLEKLFAHISGYGDVEYLTNGELV
ncbi:MAG: polysaccharide deacetylase family protein [Candidatus Pacebacteria bacterium]|nr:polysaccharide deacetylase family protein [Candidatus Paceibacterota bacterium]